MESSSWNPTSLVIDYTTRIHDTLRGLDAVKAERALRKFCEELELRMIQTREIDDACIDGLDLALAAHVANDVRSDVLHGLKAQSLAHKRNSDRVPQRRDDTLSALAKLTVLWGGTILNFYGFVDLGRSTAMPLAIVAKAYPHWEFAVQRINVAMLSRHIANITECTGYSIGNHHSTSHVQDAHRPIESVDAKLVAEWKKSGNIEFDGRKYADVGNDIPPELQDIIHMWITCDTVPIDHSRRKRAVTRFDMLAKDEHQLLIRRPANDNAKRKHSETPSTPKNKRAAKVDSLSPIMAKNKKRTSTPKSRPRKDGSEQRQSTTRPTTFAMRPTTSGKMPKLRPNIQSAVVHSDNDSKTEESSTDRDEGSVPSERAPSVPDLETSFDGGSLPAASAPESAPDLPGDIQDDLGIQATDSPTLFVSPIDDAFEPLPNYFEEELGVTLSDDAYQHQNGSGSLFVAEDYVSSPESQPGMEADISPLAVMPETDRLCTRLADVNRILQESTSTTSSSYIGCVSQAKVFYVPSRPQACDFANADMQCLSYASFKRQAECKTPVSLPTIVEPENADTSNRLQNHDLEDVTHKLFLHGNMWYRSLQGTHLCVLLLDNNRTHGAFLGEGDILFVPPKTSCALVTFDNGLLQAGVVSDRSNIQFTADKLFAGLDSILATPRRII